MQPEEIVIKEAYKVIKANNAMLDHSQFNNIQMMHATIVNANLSDLEIEGAQIGGAFIHNIGMPPKGHPMYNEHAEQRPVRLEDCDLHNSTITNCNLSGIAITHCNLNGMTINGILVTELLKAYWEK